MLEFTDRGEAPSVNANGQAASADELLVMQMPPDCGGPVARYETLFNTAKLRAGEYSGSLNRRRQPFPCWRVFMSSLAPDGNSSALTS